MSFANELYKVYELAKDNPSLKSVKPLLPISHSTANAQIEITLNENGDFVTASAVTKENAETIIPVTEDSGARSSGITPMPFADKLIYIAGDYSRFTDGKKSDNTKYFQAYVQQLEKWVNSPYSNAAVKAVYTFACKKELISDLINCGVLKANDTSGKLDASCKIQNIAAQDCFVRWIIQSNARVIQTWKDEHLYKSFIDYYNSLDKTVQLCYATGENNKVTYKNPSKIRNSRDKAKLISANDESGFTYRGRFSSKEETFSIGYEYSQKMHNALKWLATNQGESIGSFTLIAWNSALGFVPQLINDPFFSDTQQDYDSVPLYLAKVKKQMLGGKTEYLAGSKVMIMGLDAATTGRLSISFYTELSQSEFSANFEKWHTDTSWLCYNTKTKETSERSCALPRIAKNAFGTEQGNFIDCDSKITSQTILRLLPCVLYGKKIPQDIVKALYNKASQPLAYSKAYNHKDVLQTACAVIRKAQTDSGNTLYCKGEIKMAYDPNCTDKSYLFGCLLAIADYIETLSHDRNDDRATNARRLWNIYASRPYQTWKMIEDKLVPYLIKNPALKTKYEKNVNEIMDKFSPQDFASAGKLTPMYLIGYHHYSSKLWNSNKTTEEE